MSFDWMEPKLPPHLAEKHAAARVTAQTDEVVQRAALLRRLGRDKAYAVHRCLGNIDWGFELRGKSPLGRAQVRELVAKVYG